MTPAAARLTQEEIAALHEVWNASQTGNLRDFRAEGRVLKALIERGALQGWTTEDGRKYVIVTPAGVAEAYLR
jgi:hypothetical protein